MLYLLAEAFPFAPWTLFKYVTVRTGGALITALWLSWWMGPRIIAWLRELKFRQDYQPKDVKGPSDTTAQSADLAKRGTPTMGGILILVAVDLSVLLWARWNPLVILLLVTLVSLAGLGLYDDWKKVSRQSSEGISSRLKLLVQFVVAGAVVAYLWGWPSGRVLVTELNLPFVPAKYALVSGPVAAVVALVLSVLTIVGSCNAVNLTDGMDGLATGCTIICTGVFLVLTYVAGHREIARYLLVPPVPGAAELCVVCGALFGAGLGFLWWNAHPAEVFMGDTGSLAIGGALGMMAVAIHQPFTLFLAGGVFVAEALSVMVQVGWFKYTRMRTGQGRRLLRMSPLHHHFRKAGLAESKIVTRFYIAAILCGVLALSTLKIR